jgi:HD superfamily phosphohydrolase YqeK
MVRKKIGYYRDIFDEFVKQFTREDDFQNIELKARHSYAVSNNMLKLGNALDLSEEELRIARIIGLFHDLARFPQYYEFGTFRDDLTFNHALKGVDILQQNNFLKYESGQNKNLINTAILHHNKERIPVNELKKDEDLFCKLIRDADKLDIYETLINYHLDTKNRGDLNKAIELDLPQTETISSGAIKDVLEGKIVKGKNVHSLEDLILLQMGWVFDINFQATMKIIKDKKYIQQLAELLPGSNPKINDAVCRILDEVDNRIDDFSI